tara:strand:- start:182 stop:1045 length:864 start_codon:yes stop_codon:yes gene_type:complete
MEKNKLISKFKYYTDFDYIINFWKSVIKVSFYPLSSEVDMLIIDKSSIDRLFKDDLSIIPTDCRIFAHFIANFDINGFNIILLKNTKGLDCMVPSTSYYITLDEDINIKVSDIELRLCLEDLKGQWITKINEKQYIGITDTGSKILDLNNWINIYSEKVLSKIEDKKSKLCLNIIHNTLANMLEINIKLKGLKIVVFQYGYSGETILYYSKIYNTDSNKNSKNKATLNNIEDMIKNINPEIFVQKKNMDKGNIEAKLNQELSDDFLIDELKKDKNSWYYIKNGTDID